MRITSPLGRRRLRKETTWWSTRTSPHESRHSPHCSCRRSRTAEIGTLRALGFGSAPVIASVMAEAMALSVLGGVLGAGIAYLLFNGYSVSTLGGNFTQIAFNFAVTPALVLQGLVWALGIGFIGGLFPAVRAARLPVTAALRG